MQVERVRMTAAMVIILHKRFGDKSSIQEFQLWCLLIFSRNKHISKCQWMRRFDSTSRTLDTLRDQQMYRHKMHCICISNIEVVS